MTLLRLILCLGFFVPACTIMGLAGPLPQVSVFVGLGLGLLLGLDQTEIGWPETARYAIFHATPGRW